MKKRILSLILALALAIGALPPLLRAEALIIKPWLLIIDEYEDHVVISGYSGYADHVDIPAEIDGLPVTMIGEEAFRGCQELISITFPDTITHIQDYAFSGCYNLTDIHFSDSIVSIGQEAFSDCSSLTSISIPVGVTFIGKGTFWRCSELIGFQVDKGNPNYSSDFQGILFDKAKTVLIQAPATITGACLIPDNVTEIAELAFENCNDLTITRLPDSVTSIGEQAFSCCSSLTDISIPERVTHIGQHAFNGCSSLSGIYVDENNTSYSSDGWGVLFDKAQTTLIQAPAMITGSYPIPDGVTEIGDSAFGDCRYLTDISFPDSVTEIGDGAFGSCWELTGISIPDGVIRIGEYSFQYCDSLRKVTLPDSVTSIGVGAFCNCISLSGIYVDENNPYYSSDDRGVLFDKEQKILLQAPGAITGSYTIPNGVTEIANNAFTYCCNLSGVSIPDGVTSIGITAFFRCDRLTNITIPASVTFIPYGAFGYCKALTTIRFLGDAPMPNVPIFDGSTATAYYPAGNPTWTADVMQNYGGNITWIPHNPANPFTDVPFGSWFEAPVLWALENGVTSGSSETTFSPGDKCLRAQVVTFLYAAYN